MTMRRSTFRCFLAFVALAAIPEAARAQAPLDPTWQVMVNGQAVQVRPDGTFRIPNIAAPDLFGPAGPGLGPPDFFSDDYFRLTGISTANGETRYVRSAPFQIKDMETRFIANLQISMTPIVAPLSLVVSGPDIMAAGTSAPFTLSGLFADATTNDLTLRSTGTVYRTSNPAVLTVDPDGIVTALGQGIGFVTAVNNGTTSTRRVAVVLASAPTTLEGFVRYIDNSPVVGATVNYQTALGASGSFITGSQGEFSQLVTLATIDDVSLTIIDSVNMLQGQRGPIAVVPNGFTDFGVIRLFADPTSLRVVVTPSVLEPGQMVQLQTFARYPDNSEIDITTPDFGTLYTAANPAIADVTTNGLVTAVAVGVTSINVSYQTLSASVRIDVALPTTLTSVHGTVQLPSGQPAVGSAVHLRGIGQIGLTDTQGEYSANVPLAAGQSLITVARLSQPPDRLVGASTATPAMPGATNELGIITLAAVESPYLFGTPGLPANSPNLLEVADMDRDGADDLVTTTGAYSLSIHFGNDDGTFDSPVEYPVTNFASSMTVADSDGDGDADVLLQIQSQLYLFVNLGDRTLGGPVILAFQDYIGAVAIGRMDGDSLPDLLIASTDHLYVLKNSGGSYSQFQDIALSSIYGFYARHPIMLRDLDGDLDLDVILVDSGELGYYSVGEPGTVYVFTNTGNGTLSAPTSYAPCIPPDVDCLYYDALLEDLNGDNVADLVLRSQSSVYVSLNDGTGVFSPAPQVIPLNTGFGYLGVDAFVLTDLNSDGRPDLLVDPSSSSMAAFFNDTNGVFGSPIETALAASTRSARVMDVDRDGLKDLLLPNQSNHIAMRLGLPGGKFSSSQSIGVGGQDALFVDLNTDGLLDVAWVTGGFGFDPFTPGNPFSFDNTFAMLNQGNLIFGPQINMRSVRYAYRINSFDFTGDGLPDILTGDALNNDQCLSLQRQQSDGSFVRNFSGITTGAGGARAVPIDLDTDGLKDVIISGGAPFGGPAPTTLHVLRSLGTTLAAPVHIDIGFNSFLPIVADFDTDGDQDAVAPGTSFNSPTKMVMLLNDGTGTLIAQPATTFGGNGENAVSGFAADTDSDGDIDLLMTGQKTYLLLNDGAGQFTANLLPIPAQGNGAAIVDVNGDTLPDCIVSTNIGFAVLLNLGAGQFQSSPIYYGGAIGASRLFIADLDQSGRVDIGAFAGGSNGLSATLAR